MQNFDFHGWAKGVVPPLGFDRLKGAITEVGMRNAKYVLVRGDSHATYIRDVGPWDRHLTVTNDAEKVVETLILQGLLPAGRRLFYYDSDGVLEEILVKNGRFIGFTPVIHESTD